MAGVVGRSGRQPKDISSWFDKVADLTFRQAYRLINDESYPLIERVKVCLPLALRRVPTQIDLNAMVLNLNASDDELRGLMSLAKNNIDARSSSLITHEVKPATLTQPIDSKQLTTHEIKSENKPNVL